MFTNSSKIAIWALICIHRLVVSKTNGKLPHVPFYPSLCVICFRSTKKRVSTGNSFSHRNKPQYGVSFARHVEMLGAGSSQFDLWE